MFQSIDGKSAPSFASALSLVPLKTCHKSMLVAKLTMDAAYVSWCLHTGLVDY